MQSLALWFGKVFNNRPASLHTWELDVLPQKFWKALEIKSTGAAGEEKKPKAARCQKLCMSNKTGKDI